MPKKATIPKAIREQCWIEVFGKSFEHKCYIPWCKNIINVFDFHVYLPLKYKQAAKVKWVHKVCCSSHLESYF